MLPNFGMEMGRQRPEPKNIIDTKVHNSHHNSTGLLKYNRTEATMVRSDLHALRLELYCCMHSRVQCYYYVIVKIIVIQYTAPKSLNSVSNRADSPPRQRHHRRCERRRRRRLYR